MKVLITAATSAQAQQLKSLIADKEQVVMGDYFDLPGFMVKAGKMLKTPSPENPSFSHEILTLCLDNAITAIYPLRKAEIAPLAEAKQLFLEFGIVLHIPAIVSDNYGLAQADMVGIVIIEEGKIINWSNSLDTGLLINKPDSGIFAVNSNGGYCLLTAD